MTDDWKPLTEEQREAAEALGLDELSSEREAILRLIVEVVRLRREINEIHRDHL